jgi:hypothetical protein
MLWLKQHSVFYKTPAITGVIRPFEEMCSEYFIILMFHTVLVQELSVLKLLSSTLCGFSCARK